MDDTHSRVDRQHGNGFAVAASALTAPLAIALGYYVGARLGFALTLAPVPVSALWPPNAILLGGLVLTRRRSWPLVLAAVFASHLAVQFQSGVPAGMVLCWFVSNCAEALLGASLLLRFGGGAQSFETLRGTAVFLAAVFTATVASSFLDAGFVVLNGWGSSDYWTIWRTRVFSNMLATITLVPFILTTAERLRDRPPPWRCAGVSRQLSSSPRSPGSAGRCLPVQQSGPGAFPALLYAPLPLLVAAGLRFGPWGAEQLDADLCTHRHLGRRTGAGGRSASSHHPPATHWRFSCS